MKTIIGSRTILRTAFALAALAAAQAASPADVAKDLYEAAKKEGEVVLWGPPSDTVEKSYVEEFQRAFPGIRVKPIGDSQAPQRLLTEQLAGTHQADVFFWPISGFLDLEKRGLVAKLDSAQLAAFGIAPGDTALDGRTLKAANVIYTVAYDTRRLKPQDLPKTWEDLLDARWRGRIVGATLLVPGVPATLGLSKGEAWMLDFARRLRDEAKVTMVPSSPVASDMLLRGEKDLMIWLISEVLKRKHQHNEPIDWAPVSPAWSTQHVLGVLQKAPHPNAARLLALWGASREGKVAMEKASFDADARPGAPTALAKLVQEAKLQLVVEDDQNTRPRAALYGKARAVLTGATK
ncbi:MAG: ABC transporter substrate-binding protein [Betaproteobacteria bacterium]